MHSPRATGRTACGLALAAASLSACLAAPPAESAPARLGTVRAATRASADDVARMFDDLAPRVVAELPGARLEPLEIWVQETPTLYDLHASTYNDSDGFWAEGVRRIHLREGADQVERTLAHELVHASLDPDWERLPGTIEEGVCDVVAAALVPEASARLRAGRLATAAAAIGGLPIDLELSLVSVPDAVVAARGLDVRLRIVADEEGRVEACDVFVVRAGVSSVRTKAAARRAYYGLGFLVAERVAARGGLDTLLDLCRAAERADRDSIPAAELLDAAELEPTDASFHAAILEALGPAELREILRLHPSILVRPIADLLELGSDDDAWDRLGDVRARVTIPGGRRATLAIQDVGALRARLEAERAFRRDGANGELAGKIADGSASDRAR